MTPAEKLARSRLAIVEFIQRREDRREGRRSPPPESAGEAHADEGVSSSLAWFSGMTGAARAWWRHHPAQLVLELVKPSLQSQMRRKPFQMLGLAAGLGAALVVTRAWRLISLTTLLIAVVKTSQLSGAVMSALSDAQGWEGHQDRDRGRDADRNG